MTTKITREKALTNGIGWSDVINAIFDNGGKGIKMETGTRTYDKYIDTDYVSYWIEGGHLWKVTSSVNQFGGTASGKCQTVACLYNPHYERPGGIAI